MTTVTAPATHSPAPRQVGEHLQLTSGRLPRWAPWGILAASAVVVALVFAVLAVAGGAAFNIAGWAVVSAVVSLIVLTALSSLFEGRRKGVDRLVNGVRSEKRRVGNEGVMTFRSRWVEDHQ